MTWVLLTIQISYFSSWLAFHFKIHSSTSKCSNYIGFLYSSATICNCILYSKFQHAYYYNLMYIWVFSTQVSTCECAFCNRVRLLCRKAMLYVHTFSQKIHYHNLVSLIMRGHWRAFIAVFWFITFQITTLRCLISILFFDRRIPFI